MKPTNAKSRALNIATYMNTRIVMSLCSSNVDEETTEVVERWLALMCRLDTTTKLKSKTRKSSILKVEDEDGRKADEDGSLVHK